MSKNSVTDAQILLAMRENPAATKVQRSTGCGPKTLASAIVRLLAAGLIAPEGKGRLGSRYVVTELGLSSLPAEPVAAPKAPGSKELDPDDLEIVFEALTTTPARTSVIEETTGMKRPLVVACAKALVAAGRAVQSSEGMSYLFARA